MTTCTLLVLPVTIYCLLNPMMYLHNTTCIYHGAKDSLNKSEVMTKLCWLHAVSDCQGCPESLHLALNTALTPQHSNMRNQTSWLLKTCRIINEHTAQQTCLLVHMHVETCTPKHMHPAYTGTRAYFLSSLLHSNKRKFITCAYTCTIPVLNEVKLQLHDNSWTI